ncbi:DUF302 domain-containing protein [Microvirga puerhi]|uniref:DUF302 domain-containing protein n=1 Tax=Microvirga puerhi TaxID=2876078 RepID=A0ABS7VMP3_9HYPH|nr:DUF302 domain-containing protein [Microvirga puerhi]MBZ6076813.1 DUF302 domain-containing protein [Microvirga puerhi]
MAENGLISIPSPVSVRETMDRLVALLESKGLTIFARIDHGANADRVEMDLRPTELLIFGNPRAGTPLMQDRQTIGIDLPFKALAWEDEEGRVWLTYNDPAWLAQRHALSAGANAAVEAIRAGMNQIADAFKDR